MRVLGAVLLLAAGTLPGMARAAALRRRVEILLDLCRMLETLRAEMAYSARPLPELIRGGESRFCRLAVREDCFPGDPRAALERAGLRLLEDPADRELYRGFLRGLGGTGVESQLDHLDLTAALAEKNLADARENRDRRSRLCVALGLFAGVTLCLIFV